jgi:glycosyltransferase involved in cell wall biosynthesis
MNIAFIGNFTRRKGYELFIDLVKQAPEHNYYIFGYVYEKKLFAQIAAQVAHHQPYQEGQLANLLAKYRIDLCLILSISPETFSRVFFNCIKANQALVVSDTGFPAYLLKNKNYPFIFKMGDAQSLRSVIAKHAHPTSIVRAKTILQQVSPEIDYNRKAGVKYDLIKKLLH